MLLERDFFGRISFRTGMQYSLYARDAVATMTSGRFLFTVFARKQSRPTTTIINPFAIARVSISITNDQRHTHAHVVRVYYTRHAIAEHEVHENRDRTRTTTSILSRILRRPTGRVHSYENNNSSFFSSSSRPFTRKTARLCTNIGLQSPPIGDGRLVSDTFSLHY